MTYTTALAKRWRIRNDELPLHQQQNCLHQSLTEDLGEGYSDIYPLDDGLSYIETEYMPSKDLAVLSKIEGSESRLVVSLGLKGNSCFTNQQGDDVYFTEGYTSVTTFSSSVGERQYEANSSVLQLRFSINSNWLNRYFGVRKTNRLFDNKSLQLISHKPITTQGIILAQQIRSPTVSNEIKKIFIHGHAISLLTFELGHLFSDDSGKTEKFGRKDKEITRLAREILFQQFNSPPSVEQLSKRVGTNQFKLKKLFRHFFNNTPYGVLLEIRMNKAYQLLESSHCHVNIAADYVGYHHASNFSTAFTKFFGVSPKSISKL